MTAGYVPSLRRFCVRRRTNLADMAVFADQGTEFCFDRRLEGNRHGQFVAQLRAGLATIWSRFGLNFRPLDACHVLG